MPTRNKELIRETTERITVRYRKGSRTAYCSSCGKPTTWVTAEQAAEIFGKLETPIDGMHLADAGPQRLLCTGSIVDGDEETNKE